MPVYEYYHSTNRCDMYKQISRARPTPFWIEEKNAEK